jgi:hypothetical protein
MAENKIEKEKNEKELFEFKKKINELQFEYEREKHKFKMEELAFIRESDRLHHEFELTRQRIKSAEIRKDRQFKEYQKFGDEYSKNIS